MDLRLHGGAGHQPVDINELEAFDKKVYKSMVQTAAEVAAPFYGAPLPVPGHLSTPSLVIAVLSSQYRIGASTDLLHQPTHRLFCCGYSSEFFSAVDSVGLT